MEVRKLSNRTFSNHSLQNYQQKRCDLCMYHGVIFGQLDRLKEAIIMKNQRIKELEGFIAKISQMVFVKPTLINQSINVLMQKMNESDQQLQNQSSLNSQNGLNSKHYKKKFEESSQISFQDFKVSTGRFEGRLNQNSTDLSKRFQRINELNELKKQLQSKLPALADKQNQKISSRIESMRNTQQFDTVRTMSEPYQEGSIGSIAHSSCGTSRLSQISQRKVMFQNSTLPLKIDNDLQFKKVLNKSESFEDKSSISIIKGYIRKLK